MCIRPQALAYVAGAQYISMETNFWVFEVVAVTELL